MCLSPIIFTRRPCIEIKSTKMGLHRLSLRLPRIGQRVIWLLAPFAALSFILLFGTGLARILDFAHLFGVFKPHSGNVFTQQQVADADSKGHQSAPGKQVVPMIIHQIFHSWKNPENDTMPRQWNDARQSCIDLNPTWDIRVGIRPVTISTYCKQVC